MEVGVTVRSERSHLSMLQGAIENAKFILRVEVSVRVIGFHARAHTHHTQTID